MKYPKSLKNQAQDQLVKLIADKRDAATRLEQQRGLSARDAVAAVEAARKLRSEADYMERNGGGFHVQQWLYEKETELELKQRQQQRVTMQDFSAMQNELLGAERDHLTIVQAAMDSLVYNAPGASKAMKALAISKLVAGAGETDNRGNRYVTFQDGRSRYRAVVTPHGEYGIVMEHSGLGIDNDTVHFDSNDGGGE